MPAPLIQLSSIRLTFGDAPLLEGADLSVAQGERICLIGRNGSGKSTLLKIASGLIEADGGERFITPGATTRYLAQEPDFSAFPTTLAVVEAALAPGDDPYSAVYLLQELGLTGDESPKTLSGGELKRVALAAALAPEPDVLLLDEPTNHLDLPAIEWLEEELSRIRSAVVIISHDRRFLMRLSKATVWLDRGVTRRIEQGFEAFEVWRDKIFEEEEIAQQKLAREILREEHWLRYGVTARRKRNVRRLANLFALRQKHKDFRGAQGDVRMAVSEAEASGKLVIEAVKASKDYGERTIVKEFSMRVARGDRIGVVGPNGAGKTTLVNILTGVLKPDSGIVKLGANLAMVTLDQKREALDPAIGVAETLTDGRSEFLDVAGERKHVMSYMKDFLFRPEQAKTPVGKLSGGERGRLMLARALAKPSNLIVLDEPTNDLDLETLDLLEELIADYPGTVILVSHDRDFLDRVTTATLMSEGQGRWIEYAGGYSDMLAQRGKGVEARKAQRPALDAADEPAPRSLPAAIAAGARKLSFKEKHALETLPDRIAALERDIAKVQAALNENGLYAKDAARFQKLTDLLAKLQTEAAASEEEWLRLAAIEEATG
jgi:ABC transport system ATP-binding/permease protein